MGIGAAAAKRIQIFPAAGDARTARLGRNHNPPRQLPRSPGIRGASRAWRGAGRCQEFAVYEPKRNQRRSATEVRMVFLKAPGRDQPRTDNPIRGARSLGRRPCGVSARTKAPAANPLGRLAATGGCGPDDSCDSSSSRGRGGDRGAGDSRCRMRDRIRAVARGCFECRQSRLFSLRVVVTCSVHARAWADRNRWFLSLRRADRSAIESGNQFSPQVTGLRS